MFKSWNYRRLTVVLILGATICFLLPILLNFKVNESLTPLITNEEDFKYCLLRTVGISLITTFFVVIARFSVALMFFSVPITSWIGRNLSLLLGPVLLGSTATAFIFRVCFSDTSFFTTLLSNHLIGLLCLWVLLQFWQYGTLFIYLFYLSFLSIPGSLVDYAKATKLSSRIILKDII